MKTRPESRQHPIRWTGAVEIEAAVDMSRPTACLIRSVRLNEQMRADGDAIAHLWQREMVLKISRYASPPVH
jgi:hypothetical protein